MLAVIGQLVQVIWKAIILLAQFIAMLVMGILAALLLVLPWLLRMATIVAWLFGGYFALQSIQDVYGLATPSGPLLALQFTVIFMMTAWVGVLLLKTPSHIWGGLLAAGLLSSWIALKGVPGLFVRWQEADLFFRILPPALLALTMFYLTLRLRWLRSNQKLKLTISAFLWLPKAFHQAKERFIQRGNHE